MKQLDGGKRGLGQYLMQAGRSLTRAGRLAGMIQVCRPNWSTESAWYAAKLLKEQGMQEYSGNGSLADYLAQLDTRLTRFAKQHFAEQDVAVANDMELQRWANRWQYYREMASAAGRADEAIAA